MIERKKFLLLKDNKKNKTCHPPAFNQADKIV